jgi:hypothetical protein
MQPCPTTLRRARRVASSRTASVVAAAVLLVGCAPQRDMGADAASEAPGSAPVLITPPPAAIAVDEVHRDDLDLVQDLTLREALIDLLDRLAQAGGSSFGISTTLDVVSDTLLLPVANTAGLAPYGPDGEAFPRGVNLVELDAEQLAVLREASVEIIDVFERELAAWERITAALDTTAYGYTEIDKLATEIGVYLGLEAEYYQAMLDLAQRKGPEYLASEEAARLTASWMWNPARGSAQDRVLTRVFDLPVARTSDISELFSRAVPLLGLEPAGG